MISYYLAVVCEQYKENHPIAFTMFYALSVEPPESLPVIFQSSNMVEITEHKDSALWFWVTTSVCKHTEFNLKCIIYKMNSQ